MTDTHRHHSHGTSCDVNFLGSLRNGQRRRDLGSADNGVLLRRPVADYRDLNSWNWKKCGPGGWGKVSVRIKKDRVGEMAGLDIMGCKNER